MENKRGQRGPGILIGIEVGGPVPAFFDFDAIQLLVEEPANALHILRGIKLLARQRVLIKAVVGAHCRVAEVMPDARSAVQRADGHVDRQQHHQRLEIPHGEDVKEAQRVKNSGPGLAVFAPHFLADPEGKVIGRGTDLYRRLDDDDTNNADNRNQSDQDNRRFHRAKETPERVNRMLPIAPEAISGFRWRAFGSGTPAADDSWSLCCSHICVAFLWWRFLCALYYRTKSLAEPERARWCMNAKTF